MFDNRDNEGSYAGTLMVFLLGVAVGATAAILYAPSSGAETRAQIAEKAGQLKDRASDLKDQVVEKASQLKDAAASRLHGSQEPVTEPAGKARDGANHATRSAKSETSSEKSS